MCKLMHLDFLHVPETEHNDAPGMFWIWTDLVHPNHIPDGLANDCASPKVFFSIKYNLDTDAIDFFGQLVQSSQGAQSQHAQFPQGGTTNPRHTHTLCGRKV